MSVSVSLKFQVEQVGLAILRGHINAGHIGYGALVQEVAVAAARHALASAAAQLEDPEDRRRLQRLLP